MKSFKNKQKQQTLYKKRRVSSSTKHQNQQYGSMKQFKQDNKQKINNKKPLKLPSVIPKNSLVNISNYTNPTKIIHPNYILGQIIGQGAFAKARKAIRKSDNYQCVIKMYDKFRINTQQRKKALKNQVEILKNIKHQSIISLIDYYQTSDNYNLAMEYFSNCSLSTYAKLKRPLQIQQIKEITKAIAQAMVYLHQKGIAHRDLKPQNILVSSKRMDQENDYQSNILLKEKQIALKIIDFGLSMTGQENQVKIVGTPQYMAPQLLKHYGSQTNKNNCSYEQPSYDPYKADTWALGILLYWVTLGYFPPNVTGKKSNKKIDILFPVDMHPGLQYLLSKMLKQDPSQRIRINQVLQDSWLKPIDLKAEIFRLSNKKSKDSSIYKKEDSDRSKLNSKHIISQFVK